MPSKILSHRKALCNQVRRIAVEAGELVLEYFDGIRICKTSEKGDGSPVTCADQGAEELIEQRLKAITPEVPFIGEEGYEAGKRADLSQSEYFWLVDALDGTRAFVKGQSEFTVNIALIHNQAPVIGVIYAPEKGELYAGFTEENGNAEAVRVNEDTENEKSIRVRKMPNKGLAITTGGTHGEGQKYQDLLESLKVEKIIRMSSSLKICAVASGKADLYPRFGAICEWDIAAGHAILKAAGGDIKDAQGQSITYTGKREKMLLPDFLAGSNEFFQHF